VSHDPKKLRVGNELRLEFAGLAVDSANWHTPRWGPRWSSVLALCIGIGDRPPPKEDNGRTEILNVGLTDCFGIE
jgi:hypothetical protein